MALPIEKTLGFLADLIAQHVFLAGVPKTMRRRWNLSKSFSVTDDATEERLDVDLGGTPEDDGDAALTIEYDASAVVGDAIGVDINETAPPSGQSIGLRWRQAATTVFELIADSSSYAVLNAPTQLAMHIADVAHMVLTGGKVTLPTGVALELGDAPADEGTIRLAEDGAQIWRNGANDGNISGVWMTSGSNIFNIGGEYGAATSPLTIYIDTAGNTIFRQGGSLRILLDTIVQFRVPVIFGNNADAADEGDARFEEDGAQIWRDAAGTGNISGIWVTPTTNQFNVGGVYSTTEPRPSVITIDPQSTLILRVAGSSKCSITSTLATWEIPIAIGTTPATVGDARFEKDFVQSYRNVANDANHTAMASPAGDDTLEFGGVLGGVRPSNLLFDANGSTYFYAAGSPVMQTYANHLSVFGHTFSFVYALTSPPKVTQDANATASVTCDPLTVEAQGASNATGGASKGTSGPLLNTGGKGTVHVDNLDGNLAYHILPSGWATAEMVEFWADSVTLPASDPVDGVYSMRSEGDWIFHSSGGSKFWLSSGGACIASDEVYTHKETVGGGGGPTIVRMVTLDDDTGADVELVVTARASTSGDTASYRVAATFENTAGTLALVGASTSLHAGEEDGSWDADLVANSDQISVQLAHDTTETINYFIKLKVWTNR